MFYIHIAPLGLCWFIGAVGLESPTYGINKKESAKCEEKPSFQEKTRFLLHDLEVWEPQRLVGEHLFIGYRHFFDDWFETHPI